MPQKYKKPPEIIIDLRSKFTSVRDQGERPLCLAFAMSDLNAFIHQLSDALSVEYLAYHAYELSGFNDYSEGLTCEAVFKALSVAGQPYEDVHPYSPQSTRPIEFSGDCVDVFKATGFQRSAVAADIKEFIDNDVAVAIGVSLTKDFFSPVPPYIFDDQYESVGMHAMVVVGYGEMGNGESVFLLRNSWGNEWANRGYAWVTSSFCSNRVKILIGLEA